MKTLRYTVRKGDCLWDLAERYLGSPWEWPRIYTYNNRETIIKLTGKGIKDPDLIYPNQVLYLPVADNPMVPPPAKEKLKEKQKERPKSLKDQLNTTMMPFAVAYKLDDLPFMFYEDALVKATIKLSGKVAIRLADQVPLIKATNRGVETKMTMQAENAFKELFYETKVTLDNTNKITYQSLIVANSGVAQGPSTALGVAISSDSLSPVLRGEIRYPKLSGRINKHYYSALDFRVVIEVQPKMPPVTKGPQKEIEDLGLKKKHTDGMYGWELARAGALVLAATIITDFAFGLGIIDDIVTIPASLYMIGRGVVQVIWPVIVRSATALTAGQGTGMVLRSAH